jgi:MoxR-like ATPase
METCNDVQRAERLVERFRAVRAEMASVIVGQGPVIDEMLISLLCRGHCIIVGVPGLAKTLIIQTLGEVLDLGYNRIQFTPDLMPSDITGTEVIEEDPVSRKRQYRFIPGPVFSNIVLADEINRTPPKTQAALLQAMQEHKVTVNGVTHALPDPFFVLATQNPIEQEGTYPLPEAQLDRFFFQIVIGYPSAQEEREILNRTTGLHEARTGKVLSRDEILELQRFVRGVPASDSVVEYIIRLVRATRPTEPGASEYVRANVRWGGGPRAEQALVLAAKVHALLAGRHAASVEDVDAVALPALRHRIIRTYQAEAAGVSADDIVARIRAELPPR